MSNIGVAGLIAIGFQLLITGAIIVVVVLVVIAIFQARNYSRETVEKLDAIQKILSEQNNKRA